jgi:hypothetical protein
VISLNGTTEKIQIVPGTAGAIDAQGDYVDLSGTTVTPGSSQIDGLAATTATDLIPVPGASTSRRVKYLGVRNTSTTVTTTMLVQKIATGPLTIELFKCVLLPGWELVYNGATWFVYDDKGAVVTGPTGGRYLRSTVLTAGTTFTTGVDTETIRIRMVGGGGGGGGCTSVAAAAAAAGGGGAGAYAEKVFDVLPNTAYTYAIGAAGTGVAGAAGNNGGNTTFTGPGAVTVTAPGGGGGPLATAATTLTARAGGAGGAVATNGDLNSAGAPGEYGVVLIVATPIVASGNGASSELGAGGLGLVAVANGNNAIGPGAGGGGSATGASAVRTGGNGTAGAIIVEEYT